MLQRLCEYQYNPCIPVLGSAVRTMLFRQCSPDRSELEALHFKRNSSLHKKTSTSGCLHKRSAPPYPSPRACDECGQRKGARIGHALKNHLLLLQTCDELRSKRLARWAAVRHGGGGIRGSLTPVEIPILDLDPTRPPLRGATAQSAFDGWRCQGGEERREIGVAASLAAEGLAVGLRRRVRILREEKDVGQVGLGLHIHIHILEHPDHFDCFVGGCRTFDA
mmetsp:Transcript_74976/g.243647  ORF Transcript_74976/g.243647 Transcript_74976/m.243647 type:complete len:222 (-) Transcript_74976:420-1085(-)